MTESLFPTTFSVSMLEDVHRCEMYFFRRHCQRLTPSRKSIHLQAGTTFAKACEIVRMAYFNDGLSEEDAIEKGFEYIINSENMEDDIKTNERTAFALRMYFKTFPLTSDLRPVALSDGTHAIEYVFEFDTGIPHPELDQNISFKGKLDGLYERDHGNGVIKRYIVDEKTTGKVCRLEGTKAVDIVRESDKHRVDGRLIGYVWAAQNIPDHIKVDTALIRRVPILSHHEDAFELPITITPYMVQHWSLTTIRRIRELVEKYIHYKETGLPQSGFYPSYSNVCNMYNYLCIYSEGCVSADQEQYMINNMRQCVWDRETETQMELIDFKKTLKYRV